MTSRAERLQQVTARLVERSRPTREAYLARVRAAAGRGPRRAHLSCGNLAHVAAGCGASDQQALTQGSGANLGILTAYNDMLSAHQPFETYPALIRAAARELGATAQVAGGVPAMCDGVTQGQVGMELSLFSREVVALAAAVALSHDAFDAVLALGVCDKIVPGLLIATARFGHLPTIFCPAGPMPKGLPNEEKARVRRLYAEGKADRAALLAAERASYHSPGTCTFYGTANTNQMMMEFLGLHVPGGTFVNPGTPLREALTRDAVATVLAPTCPPLAEILDERALVNAAVGLLATGGSTNHTLHLVAIGRAAGLRLTWEDLADLSEVVPLLARVYPNGTADVNHFAAAGGLGFVLRELLEAGLLHGDANTVTGRPLATYAVEAGLQEGALVRRPVATTSLDPAVLRPVAEPFQAEGGLKRVVGNLGEGVVKTSAVPADQRRVEAPCRIFASQEEFLQAFRAGELNRDVVVVLRFQGPRANGMPELHGLTPALQVLQGRGFRVGLVTDGRMSGASGKVLAALHLVPEAAAGGPLARLQDGDRVRLDAEAGEIAVVGEASWLDRPLASWDPEASAWGTGRELFSAFRALAAPAADGGGFFRFEGEA